ncbi:MAG: glycosyltransferase [Rhodobacteraceae bacterium]|nr:glycosyltransferase [Paracoccaceae bacterium]
MRIVDVCAFYTPHGGGVRTYIDQKLALAEPLGHDITVIAPGTEDALIERGPSARIMTLRSPRLPVDRKYGYFDDEPAIHRALDRLAPDFVEASSPWRSPVMVANWRPEVPKALIMHADPLSAYAYRWFGPFLERDTIDRRFDPFWRHLRRLGQSFDAVVCANRDLSSRLQAGGVVNVQTNPMGVQPGLFSPARRNEALRARLLQHCGLGPDALLLVAAGRLAPEKRLPMLAEAVTMAGRRRPIGLAIFGEGREKLSLWRAIAGNPHIRMMQPVRDRERFATVLASADALLHGCEAETFCMAGAEARASGVPVIVPDQGGAAEFALQGGGIAYRAADRASLVEALLRFEPHSPDWQLHTAPRTMRAHFDDLFALYRRLQDNRQRSVA